MTITLKSVSLCILLLITCNVAAAQNATGKRSRPRLSVPTPRTICHGDKVPAGFVVVGYMVTPKCGDNSELVLKRPADTEIVCTDSPIPDGFRALGLQGSAACTSADSNPLTNALLIGRDNLVTTPLPSSRNSQRTARPYDSDTDDEDIPRPTQRQAPPKVEKNLAVDSVPPAPSREEIEIAVRRTTVILGMTMQDVSRAWGNSHKTGSLVKNDGLIHIWGYRRGEVYFRNGIVYKILLLKG